MKKLLIIAFALLFANVAHAQKILNLGLKTGSNPRAVCVWDTSNTCVNMGTLDSTAHTYSLPVPTSVSLGGVLSAAAPTNQFMTGVDTTGAPTFAQPAFTNISGAVACGQLPALIGNVTSSSCTTTIAAAAVANSMLAAGGANTVKASLNGTTEVDHSVPTCTGLQTLQWGAGTGFACVSVNAPNAIGGLTLSNDGSTPNTTLDIAAGAANDSTNVVLITGTAFTKLIKTQGGTSCTTAFVAGTGNCGMIAGVANNKFYAVFAIICTGAYDVYFDTSATAANKPACATSFRRIGWIYTSASSNIVSFFQRMDKFTFGTAILDVNAASSSTSRVLVTVTLPPSTEGLFRAYWVDATRGDQIVIQPTEEVDGVPGAGGVPGISLSVGAAGQSMATELEVHVDASSQIADRANQTSGAISIWSRGWRDYRGQ